MNRVIKFSFILTVFFAATYAEAQGCSQCKLLAEQSSELGEASFGTNINKGILILMTIPYILLFLLFRKRIFKFFKSLKNPKTT